MMKARFSFVFRQFKYRDAGEFTTKAGEEVHYKEAYTLKCDDITEDGEVYELEFTIPTEKTYLIEKLQMYKYMDEILLELCIYMHRDKRTAHVELKDVITEDEDIIDVGEDSKPKQKKLF